MSNHSEKKLKSKLLKIEINSGSDSDDIEHELSYYMKDKVKLMKEVLKLIKPKKIKSMAPDCIKHLDIAEINSMLLEELLGISNKRLQYIFNGENVDRETSSSDSDEERQPVDVISLDDISDDDIEVNISPIEKGQNERKKRQKSSKIKKESESSEKKPKVNEDDSHGTLKESERQNLMSVLELLELQARARAIKSQLALEARKQSVEEVDLKHEGDSDPDAVIIESPERKEIVLSTSDSEDANVDNENAIESTNQEHCKVPRSIAGHSSTAENVIILEDDEKTKSSITENKILDLRKQNLLSKLKKIKLIRHKGLTPKNIVNSNIDSICEQKGSDDRKNKSETCLKDSNHEITNNQSGITPTMLDGVSTNFDNKVEVCHITKQESSESESQKENFGKNVNNRNSFPSNEIDNDEIVVINLDEDEMKGIEND